MKKYLIYTIALICFSAPQTYSMTHVSYFETAKDILLINKLIQQERPTFNFCIYIPVKVNNEA